ncbi:hypothetical protein SFRURICE_014656 [Spodoptera frugiperda]|nr:hypothetical protein SFRURICE_014656 [Spodoptera frugiperda]
MSFYTRQTKIRCVRCVRSASFVKSPMGVVYLLMEGYVFSKNTKIRQGGTRYACGNRLSKSCPAYVHVSKDNEILKYNMEIIELVNGTMLIMVNGYTFHRNGALEETGAIGST